MSVLINYLKNTYKADMYCEDGKLEDYLNTLESMPTLSRKEVIGLLATDIVGFNVSMMTDGINSATDNAWIHDLGIIKEVFEVLNVSEEELNEAVKEVSK